MTAELSTGNHSHKLRIVHGGSKPSAMSKISDTMISTGSGDGGGGMESRIIRLEDNVTDIKVSAGKIETRLDNIEKNMLTKGMAAIYALTSLLAVASALAGSTWWIVQQYLGPILKSMPK
ncbi:hypothetical protein [Shewanella algae]|uniref:hypothetical protein n=1 Tax=Shewanella algae TaxID=38313 RepID=UPI001AAF9BB0|nr:hypothetical protein [Shewanella algae]MBO2578161.1 hypothetical protein [Shewanella algae]